MVQIKKIDATDTLNSGRQKINTAIDALVNSEGNTVNVGFNESFDTLADLKAKYPSGASGMFFVFNNGSSDGGHSYMWVDGVWKDLGIYQGKEIAENSILNPMIANKQIEPDKTNFFESNENLFDGNLVSCYIQGNASEGGFWKSSTANQKGYVTKLQAGKKYTAVADTAGGVNDRFRIALNATYPKLNEPAMSNFIKDENVPGSGLSNNDAIRYFTFTVPSSAEWFVLYLTTDAAGDFMLYEGDISSFKGFKSYAVKNTKQIELVDVKSNTPLIVKGKNLFDGNYHLGHTIVGAEGNEKGYFNENVNGVSYLTKVEPGKTYTISKENSDRFRIALTKSSNKYLGDAYIIKGETSESENPKTITIPPNYNFMYVYVSISREKPFMQIEENAYATEWETAGFKLNVSAQPYRNGSGVIKPEDFGAIGNANYIHTDGSVWTSSAMIAKANDDTAALQAFLNLGGSLEFTGSKKYLITSSLSIDATRVTSLDGKGCMLIPQGDFDALKLTGTMTGSAAPSSSGGKVFKEYAVKIKNIHVYGAKKTESSGLSINNCFGVIIESCAFTYLKNGMKVNGVNRNLILANTHVYAMTQWGVYFSSTCDLHQMNITGCHISYCKKNIFAEEAQMYNIQLVGNDIETSSYPEVVDCSIHFKSLTIGIYEDIEIVGNTLEDHWCADQMVVFEGRDSGANSVIVVADNAIGNSNGDAIVIKGMSGINIADNAFKNNVKFDISITHTLDTAVVSNNTSFSSKRENGGFLNSEGDFEMKNLIVSGNALRDDGSSVISLSNTKMSNSIISNNNVKTLEVPTQLDHCQIQDEL
ncbi:hypothetical protein PSH12_09835 [Enterococcus casseliflavus]|uniref:hypothetical protein n=1 Tax=Enterococcus casseliflavus TaxID=37734 RepID=UPI0029548F61|nr:hypothetical protein [Enterococcus casseliflavus]MDV7712900.1 hypothetical protein [Enterococcus casseliflavus]